MVDVGVFSEADLLARSKLGLSRFGGVEVEDGS